MTNYRPICDTWLLARPRVKYYGAYLSGFLSRARELLGITIQDPMLHVCGGKSRDYPLRGFGPNDKTVDLDPELEPDYCMDVRNELPEYPGGWPAILADPPYSESDAKNYKVGESVYPNPNHLLAKMCHHVRPWGRVGMIHYVWPRPPSVLLPEKNGRRHRIMAIKKQHNGSEYIARIRVVACIGVVAGFANQMRCYSVFEVDGPEVTTCYRKLKKINDNVLLLE